MKNKVLMAIVALLVVAGGTASAQATEDSQVKILPAAKKGVIKVLYAHEGGNAVEVRFMTNDGIVGSDKIKAGRYPKGFLKKYDISNISKHDFWIEVSSPTTIVRYRMVPSRDLATVVPYLENIQYSPALVTTLK